jgi:hypothetical protein
MASSFWKAVEAVAAPKLTLRRLNFVSNSVETNARSRVTYSLREYPLWQGGSYLR